MKTVTAGEKVKVAVLGSEGRIGKKLVEFFSSRGFEVRGTDHKTSHHFCQNFFITHETSEENINAVKWADVVIFSILPVDAALMEIQAQCQCACSRPDQLWMDVTSVKMLPVAEMLQSKAEVVGLHPTGVPKGDTWEDITLMVVPARISRWKDWVDWFLTETRARLRFMSSEEHDRLALVNQLIPHTLLRLQARMLSRNNLDSAIVDEVATPFSKVMNAQLGRMFENGAELYSGVFFHNPLAVEALTLLALEVARLQEMLQKQDTSPYQSSFEADAKHFGEENIQKNAAVFQKLMNAMKAQKP